MMAKRKARSPEEEDYRSYIYNMTKFYCPHCKHVFTYKEMWEKITDDVASIWDIITILGRSFSGVRAVVHRLNLDIKFSGTQERLDWDELARRTGYETPEGLLYHQVVTKQQSFAKVGRILGIDRKVVMSAFKRLIDPHPTDKFERKDGKRAYHKRKSVDGSF